jgi:hypothetical protein
MMAVAFGADLLLFVAGEPDSGQGSTQVLDSSVARRLTGFLAGGWMFMTRNDPPAPAASALPSAADSQPWHLPQPQIQAVNLVVEVAEGAGRRVGLVDVNRPEGRQALVDQWVGSDGVLPLLVRPDGARLQGIEEFHPRNVRTFIQGWRPGTPLPS